MANLASSLDPSILGQVQNFNTVNKADKQAQLVNQAAQIDNASKANIYKTQVLSAAVASGDPRVINSSLQGLNGMGIDTSDVPTDPDKLAAYVQAGRLAQSPLGSLLNAQLKDQSNQIQAAGTMGNANQTQFPSLLNNGAVAKIATAMTGVPITGTPTGLALGQMPAQTVAQTPTSEIPAQGGAMPEPPAQPTVQTIPKFSPPAQNPGETNTAYNQRANMAFESYKADPTYLNAAAKATNSGKDASDANKGAIASNEGYNQVVQTLDAIKKMAPDLPEQKNLIQTPGLQASYSQNFGDNTLANNYSKFKTINEAQTINTIRELADTGQIRMTRTLENIINRGYLVDPNLNAQGKIDQANAIQTELRNAAVSSYNVGQTYNGGQKAGYTSPLTVPSNSVTENTPNVSNPPITAVQFLKANPDQAPAFDAKYGQGAAQQVLGR